VLDQLDWQTRDMWRDEYVNVVEEGLHFFGLAKSAFGDPRKMVQRVLEGKIDLPIWMGQRAGRFMALARNKKWETEGFSYKGIEGCVFAAKLAAAFLAVACHELKMDMKESIKTFDRVEGLLKAPLGEGVFEIPVDKVRCGNQEDGRKLSPDTMVLSKGHSVAPRTSSNILASPLCGWSRHVDPSSADHAWRDPRECCLCHLRGDDDAGFPESDDVDQSSSQSASSASAPEQRATTSPTVTVDEASAGVSNLSIIARLGRLLPMSEGLWVHASCALWSSEVWESPRGGLINAMDKARSRGAQLKCFGCGRPGATVGCNKQNCSYNYHFPCAKVCGAVFTSKQQMFCSIHKSSHTGHIIRSFEAMKTLVVAPDKQKSGGEKDAPGDANDLCYRVGSLTVHSLGKIVQDVDGFHVEDYIYPEGFVSTRIFWSMISPRTRTVYVLKIERSQGSDGATVPLFTITPGDSPSSKIRGRFVSQVYKTLLDRVKKVNGKFFSHGDVFSKLPMVRKSRKKFFALNGPQVRP
jgi:F/Y-rich N-terminus/PHD-like zinc-binding domain